MGNAIRNFNDKRYKRLLVCVSFHISYPNTSFSFNFSLTFFSVPINSETWFLLDASNSDSLASRVCYQTKNTQPADTLKGFISLVVTVSFPYLGILPQKRLKFMI